MSNYNIFALDTLAGTNANQKRVTYAPNSYPYGVWELYQIYVESVAMYLGHCVAVIALAPKILSWLSDYKSNLRLKEAIRVDIESTSGKHVDEFYRLRRIVVNLLAVCSWELEVYKMTSIIVTIVAISECIFYINVKTAIYVNIESQGLQMLSNIVLYKEGRPALRVEPYMHYRKARHGGQIVILEDLTL